MAHRASAPVVPDRVRAELRAQYAALTPASAAAHARAGALLPGGETRAVAFFEPYPLALVSASGAALTDADGRGYLDLLNNYTSLVHGNAYPPVAAALAEAVADGIAYPSTHARQVELAEILCARVASVELVRFTNSGSEAGSLALRIARRATGRRTVVVFDGSYHGGLPVLAQGEPEVRAVPYDDLDALAAALDESVCAVVAEPFLGAGGVLPASDGFLAEAAELARRHGALFVLDEVQSLRVAPGGAQSVHGVSPDLTMLGKIIGGGLPIGAVGGRAELMELTAASTPGRVAHAGTFNGHLLAAVAGAVTLDHLDAGAIALLEARSAALAASITGSAAAAGVPAVVTRAGSILNVHLTDTVPRRAADVRALDRGDAAALHLALLLEGVYIAPRGLFDLSTVLTEADLQAAERAFAAAFARLSAGEGEAVWRAEAASNRTWAASAASSAAANVTGRAR